MAANTVDSNDSTGSECDLSMSFNESDCDTDYTQEDGIQPYQFEPIIESNASDSESDAENDPDEDRLGNTDWCRCRRCHIMTTLSECVCCDELMRVQETRDEIDGIACITEHPGFRTVCLDVFVLRTAYEGYKQYHNGNIPESPK
ncbi:uncharacterized protein [Argopecten irradians]|uniref:uncharacterized protein n=1 Tax=Argopecten irradians TaxID=31199 RepID=UPI003711027B